MERMREVSYPAWFEYDPDEEYHYSVSFPDVPGCFTEGRTPMEAQYMATEALGLHLYGMEQAGEPLPQSSWLQSIKSDGSVAVLITVNMDAVRDLMDNKAVKKTLTIPAKLNLQAELAGVNFSQLLQEALKEYLGIS